jgi:hypothetical protein
MSQDPTLTALQEQVACYRRLAKLAGQQHTHVQRDQSDELLGVLRERQGVLDEITGLEQSIRSARGDWRSFLASLPAEDRPRAVALVAEARRLLEQITAADQCDTLVLQQRKLNLSRQINKTSAARRVNRNYAAAAYGRPVSRMDVQH